MDNALKAQYDAHILPTYARYAVDFVRGEGSRLYDAQGREYIDFGSGIGVCSLGHAHPAWTGAVAAQAGTLGHVSNLYYSRPAGALAEKLCKLSGMAGAFFANSGAEANEGAIKLARKYSRDKYGEGRSTVVTLQNSFHGRTVTTLSATGQEVFHRHFHPFTEGFRHVPANDLTALTAQGGDVCAVMVEGIQGEGGVLPLEPAYIRAVEALCRERDWLLIFDEVQTGIGRTGTWFVYQGLGVSPDVVTFAKGIAGGLPLGGFLTNEKCRGVLGAGDHATTFGGNPVCCAAALAVLETLEPIVPQVKAKGDALRARIEAMGSPHVAGTRGLGLMIGVTIQGETAPRVLAERLLEAGLVVLTAGKDALRLLPPLTISQEEIEKGLLIFENVVKR